MATNLEEARGKDIVVRFDAQRCIHARHCVLTTPRFFKPICKARGSIRTRPRPSALPRWCKPAPLGRSVMSV